MKGYTLLIIATLLLAHVFVSSLGYIIIEETNDVDGRKNDNDVIYHKDGMPYVSRPRYSSNVSPDKRNLDNTEDLLEDYRELRSEINKNKNDNAHHKRYIVISESNDASSPQRRQLSFLSQRQRLLTHGKRSSLVQQLNQKPRISGDFGNKESDRPRFSNDRPRFTNDYEARKKESDRPRFSNDRPRFSNDHEAGKRVSDRPRFSNDRPRFSNDRPRFSNDYEAGKKESDRPRFSNDRPRFSNDHEAGKKESDRPRFSNDRPRFSNDYEVGKKESDRPRFSNDRPRFSNDYDKGSSKKTVKVIVIKKRRKM